jgi:hypothetical protein
MEEKASVSENQDGDLSSSSVTGVVVWSETWVLSVKESGRLEVFQMKCL